METLGGLLFETSLLFISFIVLTADELSVLKEILQYPIIPYSKKVIM